MVDYCAISFYETGNKADESQVKCTKFDIRVLIGREVLNWVLVVIKEKRIEKTYKTRGYICAIQSQSFMELCKCLKKILQSDTTTYFCQSCFQQSVRNHYSKKSVTIW